MKIHAINPVYSQSFSRRNKTKDLGNHPPITYDVNKTRRTLLTLATLGAVTAAVLLVKDQGNNAVKTAYKKAASFIKDSIPDTTKMAIGNKRDADALTKYNICQSKKKLIKLEKRIADGEFKNYPEHALKNIEKQKNKLIRQCTQKI